MNPDTLADIVPGHPHRAGHAARMATRMPVNYDVALRTGHSTVLRCNGSENGQPLLLLHGFPESGATWTPIIPYLTERGFRTVAPDLRGHGLSDAPRGRRRYRLDVLVDDVLAVIDHITGSEKAQVDLVGHDWGGALGWTLAQRHPHRIRRVVVVAAPHPRVLRHALLHDPDQRRRSRYVLAAQTPMVPEWWLTRRSFAALTALFGSTLTSDEIAHYQKCWARPGVVTGMLNWYRALLTTRGTEDDFQPVQAPLLLVTGTRDPLFGRAALDQSLQLATDGRHERLDEVGHSPHRETPRVLADLIANHLLSAETPPSL